MYVGLLPPPAHIFNPITGQHIMLEKTGDSGWHRCALLFAHKSNQLKLLQFFPRERQGVEVKIQKIGTNSRRDVGTIPFYPKHQAYPTCSAGLYFWMDYKHVVYS